MSMGSADDAPALPSFATHLPITRASIGYVTRLHVSRGFAAAQDGEMLHSLEVGWLLYTVGAPDDVVAAGVLHDVIEQCGVSFEAVRRRFGSRVARLVGALTEDRSICFWD